MSIKQEKAYSILNLNSNYAQKLKAIVEQEDKIEAQRDILLLSDTGTCRMASTIWDLYLLDLIALIKGIKSGQPVYSLKITTIILTFPYLIDTLKGDELYCKNNQESGDTKYVITVCKYGG